MEDYMIIFPWGNGLIAPAIVSVLATGLRVAVTSATGAVDVHHVLSPQEAVRMRDLILMTRERVLKTGKSVNLAKNPKLEALNLSASDA